MGKVTCDVRANQLFDVVQFGANGESLGHVSSGVTLSGALSCARGFNAHSRNGAVAVVVKADQFDDSESALTELCLSDLCRTRSDETESTCCLWDACQECADLEAVDLMQLEGFCATLIRQRVVTGGFLGANEPSDILDWCALLPVEVQLDVWNELRTMF